MKKLSSMLSASVLLIALYGLTACAPAEDTPSAEPVAPSEAVEAPAAPTDEAQAAEAGGETAYEPAYPEDVDAEGLSAQDVDQQEEAHSHGDGEGEHSHDGDGEGEHSHGDGDDTHDH